MTGILDPQVFDPAKRGLLARLASPDSHGLLSGLPPGPARDVVQLAWRGLQALAQNLTNPATYAPLPPPAWTPTPEGKLPSSDRDLRLEGALSDFVNSLHDTCVVREPLRQTSLRLIYCVFHLSQFLMQ